MIQYWPVLCCAAAVLLTWVLMGLAGIGAQIDSAQADRGDHYGTPLQRERDHA